MASMRFKAMRAKKWWLETMNFLNEIRSTHNEIEKRHIVPLQLTRISSPETVRTLIRRQYRQTYPLSTGCIDFEMDEQLKSMIKPSVYDDHFLELQKKFRRRKKKRKYKKLSESLNELHKIY